MKYIDFGDELAHGYLLWNLNYQKTGFQNQ